MTSELQLSLFRPNDTCVIHNGLVFVLIFQTIEKQTQIVVGFQFFRVHKEWGGTVSPLPAGARRALSWPDRTLRLRVLIPHGILAVFFVLLPWADASLLPPSK